MRFPELSYLLNLDGCAEKLFVGPATYAAPLTPTASDSPPATGFAHNRFPELPYLAKNAEVLLTVRVPKLANPVQSFSIYALSAASTARPRRYSLGPEA